MSNSLANLYKLCIVTLVVLSAFYLTGCGSMTVLKPINGNNCVDFTLENRKAGDIAMFGYYKPAMASGESHMWIARDGQCFDNMNPAGFNCDDSNYKGWAIDWDGEVFKSAYAKRG